MTKKLFRNIGILLLACSTSALAQSNADSANSSVLQQVENEVTTLFNTPSARHTVIENFDYSIALPNTGYKQSSSNFISTFENEVDQASITISQYLQDITSLLRLDNKDRSQYSINGINASLYKELDDKGRCKQTLKLETKIPIIVTATCNATDTININKLERSILSIVYTGPEQKDKNVYATSLFSINNGGYKLENSGLLLSVFTKSGNFTSERANKVKDIFQVGTFKCEVKSKKQKKEARKLVEGILEKSSKIVTEKKCKINDRKGFEYDILTTDENGKPTEKSYAAVVYTSDRVFLYVASANQNIDENIANYKKIAQTLKIK